MSTLEVTSPAIDDHRSVCATPGPVTAVGRVTQALLDWEDQHELFAQTIAGVPYWPRVRFEVTQALLAALVYGEPAQERANAGRRWRNLGGIAHSVAWKHPFLHRPVETVFVGHPRRKLGLDGRWHDLYCDPVIPHVGGDTLLLERPYRNQHATPSATRNIAHLDGATLAGCVRRTLSPFRVSGSIRRELVELGQLLTDRFGVDIGFERRVHRALSLRAAELPIYRDLLARLAPRRVVLAVGYANPIIVEASRSLGIRSIELQHGTVSPYHLGYHFPRTAGSLATLPDRFLAFGEAFVRAATFPRDTEVVATGSAEHERQRADHPPRDQRRTILFLSQRPVGAELTSWAVSVAEAAGVDHDVTVKLHPAETHDWRGRYPWLLSSKVRVIDTESPSLYELFATSHTQIGVSSTALYEGMTYPLRTCLAKLPGVEHMEPARGLGLELYDVDRPEEILDAIQSPPAETPAVISEQLFAANAARHTAAAILADPMQ